MVNARLNPESPRYLLSEPTEEEGAEDREFWRTRSSYHEREIRSITHKLKQYFGGVRDEYYPEAGKDGAIMANRLRKLLEQHRIGLDLTKVFRFPTDLELMTGLRKLGPLSRRQKLAYSYDRRG